jgi:2-haloacid dehalogenase
VTRAPRLAHLVLDVNETLSDLAPLGEVLREHGAPAELAQAWFASVLRDGFALSIRRQAPPFLQLAREDLRRCLWDVPGLDADPEQVVDEVLDRLARLDVHPDVAPGLRELAAAGHTLTAFSNGSEQATRDLLERAGLLDVVGWVLSVEQGSVWKPHPGAYARAAEALAARPAELTMVAVHPWDLDGAASAGMGTAWVDRTGAPWPESFRPPDVRVRSLEDLAAAR